MAALNNITSPPDIAQDDSAVALKKVQNYLYSLQEQLRFMFSNLGVENLNSSSLNELETVLTGGVKTKIQDAMDNVADLRLAADGLQLSFSDVDGNLSSLQQDVSGLTTTVGTQGGAISELQQTAEDFTLKIKKNDGEESQIKISGGTIDLKDLVFTVLGTEGTTVINGKNITTGEITADLIKGGTISGADFNTISSNPSYTGSMKLHDGTLEILHGGTTPVLRLTYDDFGGAYLMGVGGSKFSISSSTWLDLTSQGYGIRVNYNAGNPLVVPIYFEFGFGWKGSNGEIDLGCLSYPFKNIYLKYSPNVGSDERVKKEISGIDAKQACAFVDALNVVSYLYKTDDDDHKKRIGLLAGKMRDIDPAFADFFVDEDDNQMLSLRPSDLVFALIPKIQAQQKTIDELKDKVASQQQTIADLFVNVEALKSRIALL